MGIERDYTRTLLGYVRTLHKIAKPAILAWFKSRADAMTFDASEPIGKVIGGIRLDFQKTLSRDEVRKGLISQGNRTASFNRVAMQQQFGAVLGIDPFAALADQGITRDAVNLFATENADLITSIETQYLGEVESLALEAVQDGRLVGDLADDIEGRFDVSENRARLIARDQIGKLNSKMTEARQSELGVTHYIWRTAKDERVRGDPGGQYPKAFPSHYDREGVRFAWDDPPSEDEYDGHPGFPIQCVPGDTEILIPFNAAKKAYRRWHSGELTKIVTHPGESVRVTANHPVLTDRGWVAAKDVKHGDYLVKTTDQCVKTRIGDPDRADSKASEVFGSLSFNGIVHRVSPAASWLHGDASVDEKIQVVNVHRTLRDVANVKINEPFFDKVFAFAAKSAFGLRDLSLGVVAFLDAARGVVRSFSERHSLAFAGVTHAQEHRGATPTRLNAVAQQHGTDRSAMDLESLSDLFLADTVKVEPHNFRFVKVSSVVRCAFSGFVYNFETAHGWYVADGLIVHNCRCRAEPDLSALLSGGEE